MHGDAHPHLADGGSERADVPATVEEPGGTRTLPRSLRWVLTLFVAMSAFDDLRSTLVRVTEEGLSAQAVWVLLVIAGYAGAGVLLASRPRWAPLPFLLFVVALPFSGVTGAVTVLGYLLVAVAAYLLPWPLLATLLVPWTVWVFLSPADPGPGAQWWGTLIVLVAVLVPVRSVRAVAIRADVEHRENVVRMLRAQQRADAAAAREEELRETHRRERRRLGGELHDVVAHELTRIAMLAAAEARATDTAQEQREVFGEVGDSARLALAQMRRLVRLMNADAADDDPTGSAREPDAGVGAVSVSAALDSARTYLAGLGIEAEVRCEGDLARVTSDVALTAAEVLREAATNVVKHGRPGIRCELAAVVGTLDLTILVRNELARAYLDLPESGLGLHALQERVAVLDGRFEAGAVDGWWELRARLPLESGNGAD